jgi:hypothetical protein
MPLRRFRGQRFSFRQSLAKLSDASVFSLEVPGRERIDRRRGERDDASAMIAWFPTILAYATRTRSSGSLVIFAAIRRAPQNRDDEGLARFFSNCNQKEH